jgi:hypothetical protein
VTDTEAMTAEVVDGGCRARPGLPAKLDKAMPWIDWPGRWVRPGYRVVITEVSGDEPVCRFSGGDVKPPGWDI